MVKNYKNFLKKNQTWQSFEASSDLNLTQSNFV